MDSAQGPRTEAQSWPEYPTVHRAAHSRGKLVIARRVVEKIAGQAVLEIVTAGGRSGGFLGIGSHADLSARPKVSVDVSGRSATIQVEVAIAYPSPIAHAAEQVRRQMMSRVSDLAGVEVTRVDVTITVLAHDQEEVGVLR